MKVVTRVKGLLAAAVAAAGLVAFAEPVVEITKAWQANPGSGVVDFTYEVRNLEGVGACAYDVIVRVEAKGCDKTYTFTNENVSAGLTTTNVDYKTKLGKVSPNVSIYATLEKRPGGVQLWAGGPYFAECNVGAEKAEEPGYYFWWGDTVGYKHDGSKWVSVVDGMQISLSDTPPANSTYNKNNATLQSAGYIDNASSPVLNAAHDAATVHWRTPWRMPTSSEIQGLVANCDATWTELNGVKGHLIRGRGAYASNSIFLPAGGYGENSERSRVGEHCDYWSSVPNANTTAYVLFVNSGIISLIDYSNRFCSLTVRAVRDAE